MGGGGGGVSEMELAFLHSPLYTAFRIAFRWSFVGVIVSSLMSVFAELEALTTYVTTVLLFLIEQFRHSTFLYTSDFSYHVITFQGQSFKLHEI